MQSKTTIEENGKTYTVRECLRHWSVSYKTGILSVYAKIEKEICPTLEDLKNYLKNDLKI